MKSFILTICLLAVAIPSSSVVVRSTNSTQCESSASNMQSMGAAYCMSSATSHSVLIRCATVMTNEPSGNYIISSAIGSDGKLVRVALSDMDDSNIQEPAYSSRQKPSLLGASALVV